jgi:hypothetical protein
LFDPRTPFPPSDARAANSPSLHPVMVPVPVSGKWELLSEYKRIDKIHSNESTNKMQKFLKFITSL